jgi:hypothetical protein
MAHVISFSTTRFDLSKETPNPINPIGGQSVLMWLGEELAKAGYHSTEPEAEDWGWYMDVEGGGVSYLVGASGDPESPGPMVEWVVQVHRSRSIKEKVLGKGRIAADDPLVAAIERIVRADSTLEQVSVERDQ